MVLHVLPESRVWMIWSGLQTGCVVMQHPLLKWTCFPYVAYCYMLPYVCSMCSRVMCLVASIDINFVSSSGSTTSTRSLKSKKDLTTSSKFFRQMHSVALKCLLTNCIMTRKQDDGHNQCISIYKCTFKKKDNFVVRSEF